jgi:arabinogalactan oligomer/maltooligosaccharide transport system substrate-binding protein
VKKVVCVVLAIMLLVGIGFMPNRPVANAAASFSDVEITSYWATKEISMLSDQGIIAGFPDGTFLPEDGVTRAQFAKIIGLALGYQPNASAAATFPDVPADNWAFGYVATAAEKGLIKGFPDGTFGPSQPVTIAQVLTIISRAKAYPAGSGTAFSDVAKDYWAYGDIMASFTNKIVRMPDPFIVFADKLNPEAGASRAQASVCVARMMDGTLGTYSPIPVTITFWEQMDPGEKTLLEKNITDFQAYYQGALDVKFDITHYGTEDLRSNFQTAALAKSGPDLVYGPNDNAGPFSTMSLIKPLDAIFGATFWDSLMPNSVGSMQLAGQTWSVPDRVGNHLMLIYNKKLVPTPPTTTDEMITMAKALYKEEGGKVVQWGLVYNDPEPFFFVPWLGGFGGWVMDANNAPTLDSQAMIDALTFAKSLQDQKVVPTGNTYDTAESLFKEGNAGMIINGDWALGGYKNDIKSFEWGVTRIPQVSATGNWPNPMVSSKGYSIATSCPESKLFPIKMFLRYMTSADVEAQWTKNLSILPSNKVAMQDPIITSDPILKGSAYQVEVGKPMPTVPEMRAVWDAIRPQLEGVLGGQVLPAAAAPAMQKAAVDAIKAMGGG